MNIAGVEIGPDHPPRVVAEISNNHNGELKNAVRLIRECAEAGADFIKFQCYTPDELVELRGNGPAPEPWGAAGWSMRDLYEKARTPHTWFPALAAQCEVLGVPWFSSVFGRDSLTLLMGLECPAYKVAALDVETEFAQSLGHLLEPIVASSRGEHIKWADLTLYCPEGYPQDWASAGQYAMWLEQRGEPWASDGVSYHGTNLELATAIARGAPMFEAHVQLDDVPSELESDVSLTVGQLREVCRRVS